MKKKINLCFYSNKSLNKSVNKNIPENLKIEMMTNKQTKKSRRICQKKKTLVNFKLHI